MKVLVVDDQSSNRQILAWILEELGHDHVEAENGSIAIDRFVAESPDLILMDVIMPVMDGYEATRQIKALAGDQYIPVIFLTGLNDEKTLIKCLESGGDDFLTKPVDEIVLQAKMKAHVRTRELNSQVCKKNDELLYLHNRLQQEHAMGEHVLSNAMKDSFLDSPNIAHFISPASLFNGDLLLVSPKPSGGLYLFLGDFTGHGLAASIGAIPVSQAFYAMTAKGLPLSEIARTINGSLCRFLPDHMFCAATLVELNQAGDQAKVWAGGLPDGVVIRGDASIKGKVVSQHMPLGVLEDDEFEEDLEFIRLHSGDSVFLYTDGIIEGVNQEGGMFGEDRLYALLSSPSPAPLESLVEEFHRFKGRTQQDDDISIVQLKSIPSDPVEQCLMVEDYMPWRLETTLCEKSLKQLNDPIAQLFLSFPKTGIFTVHNDTVRMIVSELFSNALEHGLLKLDSSIKVTEEGFLAYYDQRQTRLASLAEGRISIWLEYNPQADKNSLVIGITDSGDGLDIEKAKGAMACSSEDLSYGRGLSLIASLAKSVDFFDSGSTVVVNYNMAEV